MRENTERIRTGGWHAQPSLSILLRLSPHAGISDFEIRMLKALGIYVLLGLRGLPANPWRDTGWA